ncbi:pyruvate kinase, cytosolic isozyme [Lathyrus oleraceus]|uniref:pyruvate kinase, cytosolic isozyme n=1 Tax=Pisum sativum TaxID=3888 RepID=UPI001FC6159C|nr:pyruvate kinase, cytosolic isozyme-like [Pisum sativum]
MLLVSIFHMELMNIIKKPSTISSLLCNPLLFSTPSCSDGTITLIVLSCDQEAGTIRCRCERKNVNLPGVVVDLRTLTDKDKEDILEWGVPKNIDVIALSFVRKRSDLVNVRRILEPHAKHIKLMSKVENQEGVMNFDKILREIDAFMVARGDLS